MNTQPQPQRSGYTPTVLMIVGGAIMLFALAGAFALHLWSQSTPYAGGEDINTIVASIVIVVAGVPVFFIGLVLLLVGGVPESERQERAHDLKIVKFFT